MTCVANRFRIRLGLGIPAIQDADIVPASGWPLLSAPVPAGRPAPAIGLFRGYLRLEEHLIEHPGATFFAHVAGESMTGFGISDGDLMIVDRALDPTDRSVVVAVVDGEFTVKQFCMIPDGVLLRAGGSGHGDVLVTEDQELEIWGVVRWTIHRTGAVKP